MHDRFFAERVVDGKVIYDTDFSVSMGNLVKKHLGIASTYWSTISNCWTSSILIQSSFVCATSEESKEDSLIRLFEQLTKSPTIGEGE